jgi:hypothetical protein
MVLFYYCHVPCTSALSRFPSFFCAAKGKAGKKEEKPAQWDTQRVLTPSRQAESSQKGAKIAKNLLRAQMLFYHIFCERQETI